ncbi:hypothetical protein [Roseovarius arcticus]|uniref:hypothetical protein n=1 Tax=Roseovarius arcticus TaxID=2547404 RepID=UPI0011107AAE|nr:hypothetical protein [Roseovarius arcticus]
MKEEFDVIVPQFGLTKTSFRLLACYRPEGSTGSSVDQIIRRYSKIVDDAARVKESFSNEQISYMQNVLYHSPLCVDADEKLFDRVKADIEDYLEFSEGELAGLPVAWEQMLDRLSSLTIGEEVALVELIEKIVRLEKLYTSWPKTKMPNNNLLTF